MNEAVRNSEELRRVLALPEQPIADEHWAGVAAELTRLMRLPQGAQALRVDQAHALHDIGVYGGAFVQVEVGGGKTLPSLLAPYVLDSQRPLMLQPASLIDKTKRDLQRYSAHWPIPRHIRLMSYEMLGRTQAEHELELYAPDLIIGDEAHRLKNRKGAACARRVARYMDRHPETRFVALSGTMMARSLLDFGHILRWCLKDRAPVPATETELEEWAAALDEKMPNGDELRRYEPGALLSLATPAERNELPARSAARRGFRRRLMATPGVVVTQGGEQIGASLFIRALTYDVDPITDEHITKLRTEMRTPDDWDVTPVEVWRHAQELSLGFHGVWDPRPPEDWRRARRAWFAFVREVLSRTHTYDSPDHVAQAVDAGKLSSPELEAWRAIRDTFVPNPVPIWHDYSALNVCAKWMQKPGIVWTEHVAFAHKLAELTGARYYGEEGYSADGQYIEDAAGEAAIIASIDANRDGKNLQGSFSRNLVTCPPALALQWQQLIGRTHRTGQKADTVEVDVFLGCLEHANAWRNALANADVVRETMGTESKIATADVEWPTDEQVRRFTGGRWGRGA